MRALLLILIISCLTINGCASSTSTSTYPTSRSNLSNLSNDELIRLLDKYRRNYNNTIRQGQMSSASSWGFYGGQAEGQRAEMEAISRELESRGQIVPGKAYSWEEYKRLSGWDEKK